MLKVKVLLLSFLAIVLAACVSTESVTPPPAVIQGAGIQEDLGQQVARHLTERYGDTRANCGAPSQPSFLCNGVMIRGTASNPTFHVWDNSSASISRGGVSVSYLRADSNYNKLAYSYTNGYILTAYFYAAAKLHPEVLCFFPIDSGSVYRADRGCGAFSYQGSQFPGSSACHLNSVVTAAQWWAHYNAHSTSRHSWQCGFDVRDSRNTAAGPAFAAGVGAMKLMGTESFNEQNEFVLAAWGPGLGGSLPLEAFFYLSGSTSGLADAKRNQLDLRSTNSVIIPVIKVTLPKTQSSSATFTYSAGDQAVTMPPVLLAD